MKTYRSTNAGKEVFHQVLINDDFTRSVSYTLDRIEKYLKDVMKGNKLEGNEALLKFYGRLHSHVKYVDFDTLNGITLQHFLQDVSDDVLEFSNRLAQLYFSYS